MPILIPIRIGMAGNQVLEWFDIDSEIKTANLKDVCTSHDSSGLNDADVTFRTHLPLPICECPF